MSEKSVAIIGAGPSGLATAKVLLDDGFNLTIFDRKQTLGGVWNEERIYFDLHTQQAGGTMEFSDLLDGEEFGSWQHTNAYLNRYADLFRITERIRFGTTVVSVHKDDPKNANIPWTIKVETLKGLCETFQFDLLVVATGLFSEPYVTSFRGQEKFSGQILHPCAVKTCEQLADKHVVVIGGGKCATDMAVVAGSFARSCHLIFRRAHWMLPRTIMGGWLPLKILHTRVFSIPFTPFPDAPHGSLFRFLHRTFPAFFMRLTDNISADIIAIHGPDLFDDKTFLPPGSFRNVTNLSVIPKNFIKLKREGKIIGKLGSIDEIVDETTIRLDSGEELQTDMIICATGFVLRFPFFSDVLTRELNLSAETTGCREPDLNLYRRVVPVGIPNIAFVGFTVSVAYWMIIEVTSHWISDYFLGRLKLPASEKEMHKEITGTHAFLRQLFHGPGHIVNYYWADLLDTYLNDMGLSMHRTSNWITEYFGVYRPERFKGLHEERKAKAEGKTRNIRHWYFGFGHTIIVLVLLVLIVKFVF